MHVLFVTVLLRHALHFFWGLRALFCLSFLGPRGLMPSSRGRGRRHKKEIQRILRCTSSIHVFACATSGLCCCADGDRTRRLVPTASLTAAEEPSLTWSFMLRNKITTVNQMSAYGGCPSAPAGAATECLQLSLSVCVCVCVCHPDGWAPVAWQHTLPCSREGYTKHLQQIELCVWEGLLPARAPVEDCEAGPAPAHC